MKRIFLYIIFSILCIHLSAQSYFINLGRNSIAKYKFQEYQIGSIDYNYDFVFLSSSKFNLAQPVMFRRSNVKFTPAPIVQYLYSLPDSIVREILIEIDSTNFFIEYNDYLEPKSRLQEFNYHYNEIRNELIPIYGPPFSSDSLQLAKHSGGVQYWKREDKWENDSMTLRLNLTFADNEVKSGQYRVRLYANFKDGNQLNSNTANDFELRKTQDSIASQYLTYLLNKDYNLSWQILANEVKAEITYEDYTKMAEITTEILLTRLNEIDLFISGITTTLSGRKYVYYTYKFNLGNPITPEYIINISFSDIEKNKIIRIHSPVLIMEFK